MIYNILFQQDKSIYISPQYAVFDSLFGIICSLLLIFGAHTRFLNLTIQLFNLFQTEEQLPADKLDGSDHRTNIFRFLIPSKTQEQLHADKLDGGDHSTERQVHLGCGHTRLECSRGEDNDMRKRQTQWLVGQSCHKKILS